MPTYHFFYNGIYSQWYPSKIVEDNIEFSCAEQYMMYKKAVLFGDAKIAQQIMSSDKHAVIKALGRKVANFDEKKWDEHKYNIVVNGNLLKFSQNAALKKKLLSTTDETIFVEASPYDRIWGIGYDSNKALANKESWGLNLLGKAINQVKEMLKKID